MKTLQSFDLEDDVVARTYLESRPSRTRATAKYGLSLAMRRLWPDGRPRWDALDLDALDQLRRDLVDGEPVGTVRRALAAVRGALATACELGLVSSEQLADLGGPPARVAPAAATIAPGDLVAMLAVAADGTDEAARDGAVVALAAAAMLGRRELTALDLDALDLRGDPGVIHHRRRDRRRYVVLPAGVVDLVGLWLNHRGRHPGPLFLSLPGGRVRWTSRRMTTTSASAALERRARAAGLGLVGFVDLHRAAAAHGWPVAATEEVIR